MDKSHMDHHDVVHKFTTLKSVVKKSLIERKVSTTNIIRVLNNLKAFHPSRSDQPLLEDCLYDLKKAKNVRSLLASLPEEHSVLQYHVYEALANELGTPKDQDLVREYRATLEAFSERELVKCPQFCDVHQVPVTVLVSKELKRQTLKQFLQSFHSRLCEIMLLNDCTLCLCEASMTTYGGVECVQVTFQVPHAVKDVMFPLNQGQKDALRRMGVLDINCENFWMLNQQPLSSSNSQKSSSLSQPSSSSSSNKHSPSKQSHKQPPTSYHDSLYPHTHHTHTPHTSQLVQAISPPLNGNASMPSSSAFPNMEMGHLSDNLATNFVTPTSLHTVGPNDVMMTSLEEAQAHFLANQLLAGASASLPDQPQDSGHKSSDSSDNEEKSSDQKPKPAPGKKTRGRVKIPMEYIKNKLRRYTTFSKRKSNIMKKAYELSTLTGTQVMLMVASETGHVYTFATPKLQPMITSEAGKALIQTCLHQPDPPQAPPTLPPEQFDVRMSSTGYEETELNNNYQMTDEDKLDNPTSSTSSASMSLPNFPPGLGLSLPTDMSTLMPALSSIQSLSGSTPGFLPPPLISPNLSPSDGNGDDRLIDREPTEHESASK